MFPRKMKPTYHDEYNIQCRYCTKYRKDSAERIRQACWKYSDMKDEMNVLREDHFDSPVITSTKELDGLSCKWASFLTTPIKAVKQISSLSAIPVDEIVNKIIEDDKICQDLLSNNMTVNNKQPVGDMKSTVMYQRMVAELKEGARQLLREYYLNATNFNATNGSFKYPLADNKEYVCLYPEDNTLLFKPVKVDTPIIPATTPFIKQKDLSVHGASNSIMVSQHELDGTFIRQHSSVSDAAAYVKIPYSQIYACINNRKDNAGGYQWRRIINNK